MVTDKLHYETVSLALKEILEQLMSEKLFVPFRLVGGTNLSLRYGHRKSVDIICNLWGWRHRPVLGLIKANVLNAASA